MAFLNNLSNLFRPKKTTKEYLLALELGSEKIKVAVWQPKGEETEISWLEQKDWSGDPEEAIKIVDEAISRAEEKLPPGVSLTKVIFGLPSTLVEKDKIKEPYLSNLKKLATKLFLSPVGFVEIPQAIAYFLEKQEGSPQTMILVSLGKLEIIASLFKVGKLVSFQVSSRTDDVAKDLEETFKKFSDTQEVLPSRILLYNEGENLEEVKEKLLSHPWQQKAAFLHFPKIEILPPDISIKTVAEAGGGESAKELTLEKEERAEDDLGFLKEKDIVREVTPDIIKEDEEPKEKEYEREKRGQRKILSLSKFFLPAFHFKFKFAPKMAIGAIVLLLIIFFGLGASIYYFLPKAKVVILVDPEILEEEMEVLLNPKISSIDIQEKQIPGRTLSAEVSAKTEGETTGKKNIGEKSRGEVMIYNKTTNSKTFKKGETLVSSNNLKFSLDDDVTVASASENIGSLTYGKEKVKVTAASIGPEGNLKEGTDFSFADLPASSYSAKSETAFSGGTSREIKVFSKEDADRLVASLSAQIKDNAKDNLRKELFPGENLLEQGIVTKISRKTFSSKIDEETTEVTAELAMNISGTAYKEEDLNTLLREAITALVPAGFQFNKEASKINLGEATIKEDGRVVFKADFKAFLLPTIDIEEIRKNLPGKKLSSAETYLREIKNVAGVTFDISSPVPFLEKRLPVLTKNITIVVEPR